jgi:hypothetical protein
MVEKTVWKYKLEVEDEQEVIIPADGEILCVQNQFDKAVMYVSTENPEGGWKRAVSIYSVYTGEKWNVPDPDRTRYIGTLLFDQGDAVFHYFARE